MTQIIADDLLTSRPVISGDSSSIYMLRVALGGNVHWETRFKVKAASRRFHFLACKTRVIWLACV
jgi:hypothetical protein